MFLRRRVTDPPRRSSECRFERSRKIPSFWAATLRPAPGVVTLYRFILMSAILLYLCCSVYGEELGPSRSGQNPGDISHKDDKSHKAPQSYDFHNNEVSSAVENAKRILGIDITEDGTSSVSRRSARKTRKLLEKIKNEFNSKILHLPEKMTGESSGIDTASLSKKANIDKEPKSTETSALEVAVPLKDSEYTEDDKSDPEPGNTVLPDDDDTEVNGLIVDQDHKADNEVELQKTDFPFKKNESQPDTSSVVSKEVTKWEGDDAPWSNVDKDKISNPSDDLPERSDEYVKTDLLEEGNDSKIEEKDVSTSDLEDKESAPPSTLGDSSSERGKSLAGESEDVESKDKLESSGETASEASASQPARDGGEELVEERASEGSTANDEDASHGDVPPVGSKLEHDVVSAIKVRAHDLVANKTVDPSELIDGTKTLFTGTDRKTLSRFSDPRGFFTNVSSKSFTHDHKSSNNAANGFISRGSNSSSYDFRKIIIYPHKKRHQTDDGRDLTAEALSEGDESIKALVGGQIEDVTPEVEKSKDKNDESGADEATLEGADQDQGDTDKEKSHEKRQKKKENEESVTKLEMYLSTDDSDDEAEKEKLEKDEEIAEFKESSVTEESTSIDTKTKTKTGKEKKKSAPDNEVDSVEAKEAAQQKETEKAVDKTEEKPEVVEIPEEELKDSKLDVGKKLDEGEGTDKKEKGKERVDEKEVETEEESKAQEEEKEKETDSDKDKVEEDQPEKPEEIASDTEEPVKGKKSSDSKKKDKPKSEEVEEGGVEKSEDTLETYSQFTQRVSAEKKNDATNGHGTNGHSKGSKVKGKNYASPDCGAKLVQANPEASHSSKVIHPSKDEYMLNKCRDKIWFVIELCESIRPQKFDIANFELFSNLPKDIQVFGSHRYPSRDWTSFGWFKGQEGNRGLQSFRIETEDFFKYIKVEVTSNYGSEFYCPISTFQIFGLSEFEVIDTIEDPVEDTDDENEAFTDPPEEVTKKKGKGKVVVITSKQ